MIDQKLSSRIRHLSILIENLTKLESFPNHTQSSRASNLLNKAVKILQKSSFILNSNLFTAKDIKYIENRILVHKLIINLTIPLKKTPLYWDLPLINPKSLYLKFLDKILNQKPITSSNIFGEFELKYNEFILFRFESFLAIYSLTASQYIKFLYFVPKKIFHNKNFTHLIFFENSKLKFWNIDQEQEDFCVEVEKSFKFIEITDNCLFAVFQVNTNFEVFDIEKMTWFKIDIPEKLYKNPCFVSPTHDNGYRVVSKHGIFYSDDLEYFFNKILVWNRKYDTDFNCLYLGRSNERFLSQNNLNFCYIVGYMITIIIINENCRRDFRFVTGSIPCVTSDKRYIIGFNIRIEQEIVYNVKLDLNTLEITDFNYEDFAQIPNLSNRLRYKYTKDFCVRFLGIYNQKYCI